jgi:hypothetical protein
MFGFSSFSSFPFSTITVTITPNPHTGGDDGGWTREGWKRYKLLQKKLKKAEQAKIEAVRLDAKKRKKSFRDLVDPQPIVAKVKQNEVESKPKVSVDIPSIDLTKYDKDIANLERKIQDLYKANALRQAQVAIEAELAVLEAKRLAELDDEEAILLLL